MNTITQRPNDKFFWSRENAIADGSIITAPKPLDAEGIEDTPALENAADAIYFLIKMPKHFGQKEIKALDMALQAKVPAAISQRLENGRYTYVPNAEGLYEVRLLENSTLGRAFTKGIFQEYYAIIVRKEYLSKTNEKTVVKCSS